MLRTGCISFHAEGHSDLNRRFTAPRKATFPFIREAIIAESKQSLLNIPLTGHPAPRIKAHLLKLQTILS